MLSAVAAKDNTSATVEVHTMIFFVITVNMIVIIAINNDNKVITIIMTVNR